MDPNIQQNIKVLTNNSYLKKGKNLMATQWEQRNRLDEQQRLPRSSHCVANQALTLKGQTLNAANPMVDENGRPRRRRTEVKGADLASTSADQLQAERRAHKTQPAHHHEGVVLYPFVLAQVHFRFPLLLCPLFFFFFLTSQFSQSELQERHVNGVGA
uniref:Uncharacterized protein n=1 Tax=Rhizophora mucronata TaxID=61149 RepID=A0A2P2JPB7_RHIMU